MCKGNVSCRACTRKSNAKVAGMNSKQSTTVVMTGLKVAGGMAIGRMAGRIPVVAANPALRIAAPIIGAVASLKFLGKKGDALAAGMVAAAAFDAVATYAPGVAAQAGIAGLGAGPMRSLHLPGVAGVNRSARMADQPVEIRMQ